MQRLKILSLRIVLASFFASTIAAAAAHDNEAAMAQMSAGSLKGLTEIWSANAGETVTIRAPRFETLVAFPADGKLTSSPEIQVNHFAVDGTKTIIFFGPVTPEINNFGEIWFVFNTKGGLRTRSSEEYIAQYLAEFNRGSRSMAEPDYAYDFFPDIEKKFRIAFDAYGKVYAHPYGTYDIKVNDPAFDAEAKITGTMNERPLPLLDRYSNDHLWRVMNGIVHRKKLVLCDILEALGGGERRPETPKE